MDQHRFNELSEEHYLHMDRYSDALEAVGYLGFAQMTLELIDHLKGRALGYLIVDAAQTLAFPHGLNGTSLQYVLVAGFRYRKLDEMGMTTSLSFQNLPTFLIADAYDPAFNVALDVVRICADAAIVAGVPQPGEPLRLHPDGSTTGDREPPSKSAYNMAFDAAMKERFGSDFDLDALLEGLVP